jgi:hypothetical protein
MESGNQSRYATLTLGEPGLASEIRTEGQVTDLSLFTMSFSKASAEWCTEPAAGLRRLIASCPATIPK